MSELAAAMKAANPIRAEKTPSADVALMNRIAAGEEAAFTQLIQCHGESLLRTIGRLMLWNKDTDDIFQEVLITVWQKAGQYNGHGSLAGWLKRIAINRCRNQFQLSNRITRKLEAFAEWIGGRRSDESKSRHDIDLDDQVQMALAKLSGDDRTILVLYYLEEMNGDDVASILNISLDAVHVRLHRARKRLKTIWNDEKNEST